MRVMVAGVPGCFVVGQQVNARLAGQPGHFLAPLQRDRQGFFHHDVNPPPGAGPEYRQMVADVGEHRHTGRFRLLQHLLQIIEKQVLRDAVPAGVIGALNPTISRSSYAV